MNQSGRETAPSVRASADSMDIVNIVTCISIDTDKSDLNAHYPQVPYASSHTRRLIFWKCAMVFFGTSCAVNLSARHYLYTNDPKVPTIDGIDCGTQLAKLGVSVIYLPFAIHKPPNGFGHIFRNNFYKLDVIYEAARRFEGCVLLADSDVVWIDSLPIDLICGGICLYPVFASRNHNDRRPNGVSLEDLDVVFKALGKTNSTRRTEWIGGEFIGGNVDELVEFSAALRQTFDSWCRTFDQSTHVLPNGSTVFDNDEILLSYVTSQYPNFVNSAGHFLRRIWTEESGGGMDSDFNLSAWHLPNEKLRGIPLLFDDLFAKRKALNPRDIGTACGVPIRSRNYVPGSLWQRGFRIAINGVKSVLPKQYYNLLRKLFGRAPI